MSAKIVFCRYMKRINSALLQKWGRPAGRGA